MKALTRRHGGAPSNVSRAASSAGAGDISAPRNRGAPPSPSSPLDLRTAFRFLRALKKNNDREWFAQHRADYDLRVKPQFEEFVAGLLIAAMTFDERFANVEPRNCIFRIYRDIRFARDKAPFKTALSAFLSPRGWRGTTPGFYIAIEPGGRSLLAAGIYTPQKPVLNDLRQRIAQGDRALEGILATKRLARYLPLDTDPLVRTPPGFAPDHPRAELIRARRYMLRRNFADAELTRGNAFTILRDAMLDTAPFVKWLNASVKESP